MLGNRIADGIFVSGKDPFKDIFSLYFFHVVT